MPSVSITFCRTYAPFELPTLTNMQFSALFSFMLWHIEFIFSYDFVLMYHRSSVSVVTLLKFLLELCLFVNLEYSKYTVFRTFLLHALTELKFCICLCFNVLQIKFECRQFASIFVGVMPLLELRILEIHSIPHFSLTPFGILSWNFACYFFFCTTDQVWLSSIYARLQTGRIMVWWCPSVRPSVTVFRTFHLHALTDWSEILCTNLFLRSSSKAISFHHVLQELYSFWTLNSYKYAVFHTFSYILWHIEFKFCIWLCFNVSQIKCDCRHFA